MMHRRRVLGLLGAGSVLPVMGCGAAPPPATVRRDDSAQIASLANAIAALGPQVSGVEAARAAHVSYEQTQALAIAYQIEDPPLVHNAKVNRGTKPRGLCWHWAEDMQTRLAAERFSTLSLHRAIANADNPFRIDHSTVIVSRRGDGMYEGIVLDPWRKGGVLHWAPVREDTRYHWVPRQEVFRQKLERQKARERQAS